MRTSVITVLISGALALAGCTGADQGNRVPIPVATGGSGGTNSTPPSSTGGSGGSISGESGGSGGAIATTGGSGGTPDNTGGSPATTPDGGAPASDGGGTGTTSPPVGPGAPPNCPTCRKIFDGTTLDGWQSDPATGAFEIKDGAIASTGKVAGGQGANLWTKEDFGDYRIFFSVRQIKGGHKPCTTIFNDHPNGTSARGLHGIQYQPPLGGSWDYRAGKNSEPDKTHWMYPAPRPTFDVTKWNRCEVLVKASGEFHGACCEIEGKDTCTGIKNLDYADPSAGRKGPFNIMMHNAGLFDEYKDIWVETDPTSNDLISTKY